MGIVTIEISNRSNRAFFFKPIGMKLRGALDWILGEPALYAMGQQFAGKPIPGQRIALDIDKGEAAIYDPLSLPEFAALAEKIRAKLADPLRMTTLKFAETKRYEKIDVCTWLHHMRRAVEAGIASVVSGDVNTHVPGEPQREFLHRRPEQRDKRDETIAQLTRLVEQQSSQIAKLLAAHS